MRRVAVVVAILGALSLPARASAQIVPAKWLSLATVAAKGYWHATPQGGACATGPRIVQEPLTDVVTSTGAVAAGEAAFDSCTITLNSSPYWFGYDLCIVFVHEWGHLVLGPDFFQASNPADPAHSLATSGLYAIMQESENIYGLNVPQCDRVSRVLSGLHHRRRGHAKHRAAAR